MKNELKATELKMIPISLIEVLNPRERNQRVFDEITRNIKQIGLKKPITVTSRPKPNGDERYILVCGEGRMKAFMAFGESEIPAIVVDVDDDEAFIMSLVENIARRQCRSLELLAGVQRLRDQGYEQKVIADKTGLSIEYIRGILQLLEYGEERLLVAVETGKVPLYVALQITKAGTNDADIQNALQEAYESGQLKGKQLTNVRNLISKRQTLGKSLRKRSEIKMTSEVTSSGLIRSYKKEVDRQKLIVKKSDFAQQRLMFVIGALRTLFMNENFINLLRAEKLDTLPTFLSERVWPKGHAV
jgi:ParB family chromosome partitioning protein